MTQVSTDHPSLDQEQIWAFSDKRVQPGSFAPHIHLPSLYATDMESDFHSGEETILLFWASWCKDCVAETPGLVQIQREYPTIRWITVSLDNQATEARKYIHANHLRGTHLFDGRNWEGAACEDYAVPLHGIPYIIYIGKDGRILWCGGTASGLDEALHQRT